MKKLTTKKLFAFITMVMFSFTFVNAQDCPGNKIRVYKCSAISFGCHSKCGFPNNAWSIWCPCEGRIGDEQAHAELFMLDVSPNPISGSTVISFFLKQSENVSLNIFDMSGKLITTLANASFHEGDHEITWNAADLNAGFYFLRMEAASYSENLKLIVTK